MSSKHTNLALQRCFRKYEGEEDWGIIKTFATAEEAVEFEASYIEEFWDDPMFLNQKKGDAIDEVFNKDKWDPATWPAEAQGFGPHEAPRGALGHWVRIKEGKIENYQCVVPSTWNCSPRDAGGQPGAYEASLLGTPLADPEQPLEILRTIHSFDPCMACGVHIVDTEGRELTHVELEGRM